MYYACNDCVPIDRFHAELQYRTCLSIVLCAFLSLDGAQISIIPSASSYGSVHLLCCCCCPSLCLMAIVMVAWSNYYCERTQHHAVVVLCRRRKCVWVWEYRTYRYGVCVSDVSPRSVRVRVTREIMWKVKKGSGAAAELSRRHDCLAAKLRPVLEWAVRVCGSFWFVLNSFLNLVRIRTDTLWPVHSSFSEKTVWEIARVSSLPLLFLVTVRKWREILCKDCIPYFAQYCTSASLDQFHSEEELV
jgi:hypothetical protein